MPEVPRPPGPARTRVPHAKRRELGVGESDKQQRTRVERQKTLMFHFLEHETCTQCRTIFKLIKRPPSFSRASQSFWLGAEPNGSFCDLSYMKKASNLPAPWSSRRKILRLGSVLGGASQLLLPQILEARSRHRASLPPGEKGHNQNPNMKMSVSKTTWDGKFATLRTSSYRGVFFFSRVGVGEGGVIYFVSGASGPRVVQHTWVQVPDS